MKTEPIKLDFKSGKLYFGDYEVVNPEVIPWTPGGFERCVDGDQITLPEGYGIEDDIDVCELTCEDSRCKLIGCGNPINGDRRIATITLPEKPKKYEPFPQISELSEFESEKPENSAHGDATEAIMDQVIADYERIRDGWKEGTPQFETYDLAVRVAIQMKVIYIDTKKPVVEPSESQEEPTDNEKERYRLGYKDGYSEGKKEGWNEAIIKIGEMMVDKGYVFDLDMNALLSDIQKLRK